jgi:transposase-like protein
MSMTVLQIADRLRTEADAYRFLEEFRWPDGEPTCPHCGTKGADYIRPRNGVSRKTSGGIGTSHRRVWRCHDCRRQFSVLTSTVMHGTKASVRMWVLVIFEMCLSKNGVSAFEISRKYGVCQRTAWFMCHRIRAAMDDTSESLLHGVVMADETYFGGREENRHARDRHGDRGIGGKTPVFTLIEKHTGEARSRVVPRVNGTTLYQAIKEGADPHGSLLWTDSHLAYGRVGRRFVAHETVNHSEDEYVSPTGATTNPVEGFFSQLKRSIDGTHHHVSTEHLDRYLAEFDFRFSTRKLSDTARMSRLMGQAGGKRLTYKLVTA